MSRTHLVIGDAHADPGVSNRRFDWLGEFILEYQPDVIIDIGDFAELGSLSSYDKGKRESWGKTFAKDIAITRDANKRSFGRIEQYNQTFTKAKKKLYRPKVVRILGNHDQGRIDRFLNDNPELEGTISIDQLGYQEFGGEVVKYKDVKIIDDIAYSHFFYDRDARYPLQSANTVLRKKVHSACYGHSHLREMAETVSAAGRRVIALNVGCYLDKEQNMQYAGAQANSKWWRGLCLLTNVDRGSFDPKFFNIEEIQRKYS